MYFHMLRKPIPYVEIDKTETIESICDLATRLGAENSIFVFNGPNTNVALIGYPESQQDMDQYRAILYDFTIASRAETITYIHPAQTSAFELSEDARHQILVVEVKPDLSGNAALGELLIVDNMVRFRLAFNGTHKQIRDVNFDLFPDFHNAINHDNEDDIQNCRQRISAWIERIDWAWNNFDAVKH